MSNYESFDDFYSTERVNDYPEIGPFQFREEKDPEATLEWLNANFDGLLQGAHSRLLTYRRYMALYKGIQWRSYDVRDTRRDGDNNLRQPRHVMNFVHDMTEARVAQNAKMKSSVAAIPHDSSQGDINNARFCKMMIDAKAYEVNLEKMFQENDRSTFNFGDSFLKLDWNPEIGPIHPTAQKAIKQGSKKKIKGKKLEEIHIGDVELKVYGPDRVFPQHGITEWAQVDELTELEWIHKDKVAALYPDHAKDLQDNAEMRYDFTVNELTTPKNFLAVKTFWHKPTKWLPKGAKITFTKDVILEWIDFPFNHNMLPFIKQSDIDVYGELWGRSYITNIEQMQRMYNNIQSGIARDFSLGSAPKWVMPKGSVDVTSVNNEFTLLEYTGMTPPQMITPNATARGNYEIQDRLESKITQQSSVYDISRGEVPQGVTANSALRFLDEQESQRIIVQQQKRKDTVLKTYRMMLSLMQQYYKADDGRMVRILGKTNEYMIESMESADFTKVYDVQLQNTSSLPDTKAGKIAAIVDLNAATQADPIFTKKEVVEMLELGNDSYFKEKSAIAATAARTNLDKMLDGKEVVEPKPWEDLIVHYDIFTRALQEATFKTGVAKEIQEQVSTYVMVLEGLMYERATKNQKFLMQMLDMDEYPIFFTPDKPLTMLMAEQQQQMAMVAQAGSQPNQGADLTKAKGLQEGTSELAKQGEPV